MSTSKEGESKAAGADASSSLMGLFSPPAASADSSQTTSNDKEQAESVDSAQRNENSNNESGSVASLQALFQPPKHESTAATTATPPDKDTNGEGSIHQQGTVRSGNSKTLMDMFDNPKEQPAPSKERTPPELPPHERLPLLHNRAGSVEETAFGDLHPAVHERGGSGRWGSGFSFADVFQSPSTDPTPKISGSGRKAYNSRDRSTRLSVGNMPAIDETHASKNEDEFVVTKRIKEFCKKHLQPTTFVGAFMFLLYHVVFCLAMGSSIIRPHSEAPIIGLMAKMAACGIIFASPVYIMRLGSEIPALYPTADLFLAPFMANLAFIVDDTLQADDSVTGQDEDQVFIATLAFLSGIGMTISGTLLVLASKFKLANLGSYLPFPVLCGFFSAVGLMMWSLAFTVDTNGKTVQHVLGSGDMSLIGDSLLHHFPSFFVAVIMKWLGPKNPFYVSILVMGTIVCFYLVMAITGTTLEQAREKEWFWSEEDLVYRSRIHHIGFDRWAPPAPFGVLNALVEGKVHWGAVSSGLSTVLALSFLYLLRCSLHGTALKKNVSNLVRIAKEDETVPSPPPEGTTPSTRHRRLFSEALDIEAITTSVRNSSDKNIIRAKKTNISLEAVLLEYGISQFVSALVGSFGVTPSVAACPTMFSLGADGAAPQYGSIILLLVFYLTNFTLVGYIPKAAFSCLIVLAFLDIMITWCFKSYHKTQDKLEWLVVPVIIVFAFVVGLLNAVLLGIAASTLIFVTAFFRSGVVKYVATGVKVRSTIERSMKSGVWLDENGDLIQILVLQNYLFFGNSSSILNYISTMFDEPEDTSENSECPVSPPPKYVILDFTLVTGMDTSTADVLADIVFVCHGFGCKLFLAGVSARLRTILQLGGIKPETGERSKRKLRFFPDLDSAVGKAEDMLLRFELEHEKQVILDGSRRRLVSEDGSGFRFALEHIDEQHGGNRAIGLLGLQKYTSPLELAPGECLFSCDGGPIEDHQRGLFFIEEGVMKIERDSSVTLTRGSINRLSGIRSLGSLTGLNARTGSHKNAGQENKPHNFRLARIGPGWVVGTIEGISGEQNHGIHVAVSHCRLHHLPFSKIQEIEEKDPALVLRLYKVLSGIMARRQEITIQQLATLHSIMTSPAQTVPISKAVQKAL